MFHRLTSVKPSLSSHFKFPPPSETTILVPWEATDRSFELEDVWRFFISALPTLPAEETDETVVSNGSGDRPYISNEPLLLYSPHAISVLPGRILYSNTCLTESSPRLAKSVSNEENGNGIEVILDSLAPEWILPLNLGKFRRLEKRWSALGFRHAET